MTRLLATLILSCAVATPALAKDGKAKGQDPLRVVEKVVKLGQAGHGQRVVRRVKSRDADALRAAMAETFGAPTQQRGGVSVWTVPSRVSGLDVAEDATISIGPDARGELVVIYDDRAPSGLSARLPTRAAPLPSGRKPRRRTAEPLTDE